MRKELKPDLETADKLFPLVLSLISRFDDAFENGNQVEQKLIVSQLSDITKKQITEFDLYEYWGYTDIENLAYQFAIPDPEKVEISKAELIEILKNYYYAEEKVKVFYTTLLDRSFPHPNPTDVEFEINDENSISKAADSIMNYKPILL